VAVTTNKIILWDVTKCRLVYTHWRLGGKCCLHHKGKCPDTGGSRTLWGNSTQIYTLQTAQRRTL